MEDSSITERSDPRSSVRLQLLGPLRAYRDDIELETGPPQQGYLLALLLARAGRPTSMSELVDLLWEENVPMSAVNTVQKYVGTIRRMLEPDLPAREAGSFIARRGGGYAFVGRTATVDLIEFRSHVESAKTHLASGRHDEAVDEYAHALGLWHGPAGDGLGPSVTTSPLFASINEEFFDACVAVGELARTRRPSTRILQPLRLAAWMAPLNEPVQAGLMTALAIAGKQAEALSVFETVRARLADDLGVTPGEALQAARTRVVQHSRARSDHQSEQGGSAPLVGRGEERALLARSLESAVAGNAALIMAEGEPGAGKTSLFAEFGQDAERRGALVVWGRSLNHEGTPALWPWTRLISDLLASQPEPVRAGLASGEIRRLIDPRPDNLLGGAVLPDSGAQFRLFEQAVDLIRRAATERPVVLVIDDLQWADAASLQLFRHVATQQPAGVVLAGLLRDRAPAPGDGLGGMLAAVGRLPHHQRIRIGPLQPTEVGELVRRETGRAPSPYVARCIQARTEGNPFFVRELARLLADSDLDATAGEDALARTGVPSTVRDIVRDRLAGLDHQTRRLVEIAALIGREVDVRLLARAAGVGMSACSALLATADSQGLLEPAEDRPLSVRFVHDLVREAVHQTTSRLLATGRLHLQIADALEGIHGDDEAVTERLAHHLWLAGPFADPTRTTTALVRGGRRAVAQSAFDAAVPHLEAAADIAHSAGLLELELSALSQLVAVIGMQTGYMGSADATFELLERAERAARGLGREREAADFLFSHWAAHSQAIQLDRSGQLAHRLLADSERSEDPVVQAYGRHAWGIHQWDVGNIGAAYRHLSESNAVVAERAKSLDQDQLRHDLQLLSPAMLALNTALHGKDEEARGMFGQIESDAGNHSYDVTVWSAFAVTAAALMADPSWTLRAAERGIAADPEYSFRFLGAYQRLGRCWAHAVTGRNVDRSLAQAEELIESNLADPPRSGLTTWLALLSEMYLASGRVQEAADALRRADSSIAAHGQRYAAAFVQLMHAKLRSALGEPMDAVHEAAGRARATAIAQQAYLFVDRADDFLGLARSS
ncbi:BTAD domain-containing putative transcriptional regulator [Nocardioides sp. NPDC057577]|uniref:BTAD domain-containing putative transcriptional regulator n=1 Tax=Nocardioides sp. NPDC057577 TaxID=3346171 RepID=UPI00366DA2A9